MSIPGCQVIGRIEHPRQRNDTWLVRYRGADAVAKRFRLLSTDSVAELCAVESRLRSAGVPVPELVYRSVDAPVVAHALVHGEHITHPTASMVSECVRVFASQLLALRGTRASWAPGRPDPMPRRARAALDAATSADTRELVVTAWRALVAMARGSVGVTSHADWRADNILFHDGRVAAVFDWEDLVLLPAAEAVGYAAASLTHTWREEVHAPVTLEPIELFLALAEENGVLRPEAGTHARTAALYLAAVRLAEDQRRGLAVLSGGELRKALGDAL
ncbi:phosphotransferase [Streptomyces sp. URMC 125]|uniref:phosphotransferase n=1 Tax=Streptomyces sp. URMC 125 TaxID=3423419 RepID=UPI003F1E467F